MKYCYIEKSFYDDHPCLKKILDQFDEEKRGYRTHLCLNIQYKGNNILIPLRKNMGLADRKFGNIGHQVSSESKPLAGLDYRYIMIINDMRYLRFDTPRIPNKQASIIDKDFLEIEREAIAYIEAYIRVAIKNRAERNARFRESSLINFHKELFFVESVEDIAVTDESETNT
jgi:protein AbiQ